MPWPGWLRAGSSGPYEGRTDAMAMTDPTSTNVIRVPRQRSLSDRDSRHAREGLSGFVWRIIYGHLVPVDARESAHSRNVARGIKDT